MATIREGGLLDNSRERVARLQWLKWCIGGGAEGPHALSPQELSPLVMVAIHTGESSSSKKGVKKGGRGRAVFKGIPREHHVWGNSKPGGRAHQTP